MIECLKMHKENFDYCLGKLIRESEEKDKEIERLNNIIEEYKNANEYHQNIIHELETMKQPNQLHSENIKLRADNNRLNNIINKAIEILDIYGTSNYETADLLYSTLRGSDKE